MKTTKKNDNKGIITAFLGHNGNLKLGYKNGMEKFFKDEANKDIRPDAFRFYFKKVSEGTIVPAKKEAAVPVVKAAVKIPASKPTVKEIKKAVAKTKVTKAPKI